MKLFARAANKLGLLTKSQVKSEIRSAIRSASATWQAASINRLTASWTTQSLSADSKIKNDLEALRARSRQLCEEDSYGRAFINLLKNNVVGEVGIQLKNKAMDPPTGQNTAGRLDKFANRVIEDAWWNWGKRGMCTVDKSMTFVSLQNQALETTARDGEALFRVVRDFNNPAKFAVQPLESDILDHEYNVILGNGNEIRMGVELNSWREPIAYHLLANNPNDNFFAPNKTTGQRIRTPASEIIHLHLPGRPQQTRHQPWLAAAMFRMNMIGKYEEAEVTAARASASKMAFLTRASPSVEYTGDKEGDATIMDAEPGAIEQLPAGMDIKALDWNHPNSSYQVFMKTALRGIASALGVSYNTLANDMESVNFASGKLGIESERELWKSLQCWFAWEFIDRVFTYWLEAQLVKQIIKLPFSKIDKFNAPDWRPRRWSYVNPQQEVAAKIQQVQAGFTSISRVIAEAGGDRDELFQEIADDQAKAKEMGIDLPAINPPEPMQADPAAA